ISEALLYPLPPSLPISLHNSLLHKIQETSISKNNIQESTPYISTNNQDNLDFLDNHTLPQVPTLTQPFYDLHLNI
ncbi:26560_t:CDS:1, partial [Racocetra persica]